MTEELNLCPLTRAIQRINSTPYSLTKDECVEVLRSLRDEISAFTQRPAAQTERWIVAAVDAAMVEMKNISPPLRRSECERLIRAAAEYLPAPQQATPEPVKK